MDETKTFREATCKSDTMNGELFPSTDLFGDV
jgi:hypothetical protein